jgi:hypothetical protein
MFAYVPKFLQKGNVSLKELNTNMSKKAPLKPLKSKTALLRINFEQISPLALAFCRLPPVRSMGRSVQNPSNHQTFPTIEQSNLPKPSNRPIPSICKARFWAYTKCHTDVLPTNRPLPRWCVRFGASAAKAPSSRN